MTFAEELAVEEYKSLRHEIDALTSESRLLVRLSLTGAAAIYAWLAVNAEAGVETFGWYIPIFIPLFGLLHSLSALSRVMLIAEYVRDNIDPIITVPGWESFLHRKRTDEPVRQQLVGWSYSLFWIVFLVGTGLISALLGK